MTGSGGLIGRTISHYRILEKLGGGGMGVVYKAEDISLGRPVALKFLSDPLAGDIAALERFQREARMASALDHPNICTIYEIGEHTGLPFLAMQYLEGETLEKRITANPLTVDQVVDMGIQIADGLDAAHSMGIIHRDIKPSNIFVTKRDQPKILDFGVAKLTRALRTGISEIPGKLPSTVDALSTVPGARIGTFAYMSPEQERGEELDARTDLFSFGLMLYDMATGWHSFSDKVAAVIHDAVGSQEATVSRAPALPAGLANIISKATQVDPNLRYQSAADMRCDLMHLKQEKESGLAVHGSETAAGRSKRSRVVWTLSLSAAGVAAVAVGAFLFSHRVHALNETDTVVLADFANSTGDAVFDDTLKQALATDLQQSPFFNILSDRRVDDTLKLMGRTADQHLDQKTALELCLRSRSKAVLAGSIASLGTQYVVGLNALTCLTGDSLAREESQASKKEDVLNALGKAATKLREKVGESLSTIQKYDTPIEEATTPSLEALKAYSMGRRAFNAKGDVAALPYYERAVELDPNFALAYRFMVPAYANLGQDTRARQNANKAFQLRDRVSEPERYAIEAAYYSYVTGDLEKANQVYELWKQSYPRHAIPFNNLGDDFMRLGQWEVAFRATQDALRVDPNVAIASSNLAWAQLALNRTEDARATIEQAQSRNLDAYFLRLALYQTAFLRTDQETMREQLSWAAGRSGEEDWLLSAQSDTEAYFGRLGKAREFSQRAADSARRADARETAALWQANAALREAEFGNAILARHYALAALALMPGKDIKSVAALSQARAGDAAEAKRLTDSLQKDFPQDTRMQGYWLPSIRAAIELNAKNPVKAIELLRTAVPYELGQCEPFQLGMMYPVYLRGQGYLLARQGEEAAEEFQKIIDHRGVTLNFPLGALAHASLGRAYALQGDTAKAKRAYEDFLALWKTADSDIPILKQAKVEYAKLK